MKEYLFVVVVERGALVRRSVWVVLVRNGGDGGGGGGLSGSGLVAAQAKRKRNKSSPPPAFRISVEASSFATRCRYAADVTEVMKMHVTYVPKRIEATPDR